MHRFERDGLSTLFRTLQQRHYSIIAPTIRDSAVVLAEASGPETLPAGWTDDQAPGSYHLRRRPDGSLFGWRVGPHSWKQFLFPPEATLLTASRSSRDLTFTTPASNGVHKYAFIGVRPCELQAIGIQDRVFHSGEFIDPVYQSLRQRLFLVAVNCTEPGATCFCSSMHAGPEAERGYDIVLTEQQANGSVYFLAKAGSNIGEEVLREVTKTKATADETARAAEELRAAASRMGRSIDTAHLKELLYRNTEHPRWDETAHRCLACGNCTQVCPTCFCSTVEDVTDLAGRNAERRRVWDSCFTLEFSYIHGGAIRSSLKSRYRHWITHKLASWQDQFGVPGCVGCGRCITWCPVGIDITEEAAAIRDV